MTMKKILLVAEREFLATAGTRAFLFGVLVTPSILAALIFVMPRLITQGPPTIEGQIAVIDATGLVSDGLRAFLQPDQIAKRREAKYRRMQAAMPPALRTAAGGRGTKDQVDQAFKNALGEVPRIEVVTLSPGSDPEAAKEPLKTVPAKGEATRGRLALVVVHPDALAKADGQEKLGTYDLYVRGKLDDRVIDEINDGMKDAIVGARIAASGLDRARIDTITRVDRVESRTVTASGEGTTNETLNALMPAAFMVLLLVSVLMSGQYLLTTTVEEKSNRVVEVLLSALSPMELMTGKILGQLAVGMLVLVLYLGLGVMALMTFASLGLLDPVLIVFLIVFFLLAYVSVGSFMAAIGSAVNEMREAQGLMTPVMLFIMIPWILWMPISRDPNSMFATVLSFIPPLSNFVMMLRMASASPPPIWQPLLAVVVGAIGAYASLWFAGKVFRIGLLMFGKPPDFKTLIRWARMG